MKKFPRFIQLGLLLGSTLFQAHAASGTWTNTTSGGLWSDGGNWSGGTVADGSGFSADFSTLDIAADNTVHLDSARMIGGLSFGDTTTASAAGWILDNNGVGANILTLAGTTPTITANALGTGKNVTVSAVIAGAAGLTKAGNGTLVLIAANTYNSTTSITAGTLALTNTSLSNAYSISSGAVLELNAATTRDGGATASFSGAGTLRKTGAGTLVWGSTVATFQLGAGSLIDVQGGTLTGGSFGNDVWTNNLSGLNVASGAIFDGVEANVRVDALSGSGTIKSAFAGAGYTNFTIGVNNGTGTFSGVLANSLATANFVKTGTGTQTLSGASTYTGATTVNAGTLKAGVTSVAGVSGAFGNNSAVTMANIAGAVVDITGFNTQIGKLSGGGNLGGNVTLGAAALTIGNGLIDLAATYAGAISGTGTVFFSRQPLRNRLGFEFVDPHRHQQRFHRADEHCWDPRFRQLSSSDGWWRRRYRGQWPAIRPEWDLHQQLHHLQWQRLG